MVSKRDLMSGLANGVRCRVCGRKLTNQKSVDRQIGPVCWSKLEKSNLQENMQLPLHKYETRCSECKHPIKDVKHILLWRDHYDVLCTRYCCACCPETDSIPCPREAKQPLQKVMEAFV